MKFCVVTQIDVTLCVSVKFYSIPRRSVVVIYFKIFRRLNFSGHTVDCLMRVLSTMC